jgi:hypothetical protein
MVRCALWLEDECACDVLAIGHESFAPVQPADAAFPPELLLTVDDGAEGWRTVRQLITALERGGLAKLQPRPFISVAPARTPGSSSRRRSQGAEAHLMPPRT